MTHRRARIAAILSAAALILAACSDSDIKPSQSGDAATAVTTPAAANQDAASPAAAAATPAATQAAGAALAAAATKLNLNSATREQFLTVPGVGDRFVREFMEYRPYTSILQFRRELGKYVSQEQVAQWEKYVYVPVDPNRSDAETLRQLPGVDAGIAAQLIAARPYATTDAFLTKVGQMVPADAAASARALLATS